MIGDEDVATTPFVAVINQALADKYFPGQDPLQKEINLGGKDTGMIKPYTIVGVLADQVDRNVGGVVEPLILLSQQQIPTTSLFYQALLKTVVSFVVKSRGEIPIAAEMRSVFHQLAPGFALDNFSTMDDLVQKNTFSQRLGLYLVGSFAGLAIVMVVAGLYGVLSQLVSQRRREIGIRLAVGSSPAGIFQLFLREGMLLIGCGLALGLVGSAALRKAVENQIYGVQPFDPIVLGIVIVLLGGVALAACLRPAQLATKVDPLVVLNEQ